MTEHRRPVSSVRPGFSRQDWDARYERTELLWTAEPNRLFAAEVAALAPGRALDIACGEGRNAVWLAERGWNVTAVDFSGVALAKGERLAVERGVSVRWVLDDVLEIHPPPRSFDLVLVLYLQLPAEQLREVIAAAGAAVAAGGTLFVLGHDTANLSDGYGGPKDEDVLFTPGDVVSWLTDLIVERAESVRRSVTIESGEVFAIDALVRARRPPVDG